jgi:hypothetical protein
MKSFSGAILNLSCAHCRIRTLVVLDMYVERLSELFRRKCILKEVRGVPRREHYSSDQKGIIQKMAFPKSLHKLRVTRKFFGFQIAKDIVQRWNQNAFLSLKQCLLCSRCVEDTHLGQL